MRPWPWLIAVVVACGKPATMPKPPADLDTADAGASDGGSPVGVAPIDYGDRPAPGGPSVSVKLGAATRLGDLEIAYAANNHKQAAGGDALGIFGFEIRRGGETKQVELRSMEVGFEAELDAHGSLLVFRHLVSGEFVAFLAAPRTPTAQTEQECAALIDAAATAAGRPTTASRTYTDANGVLVMLTRAWRGYCGRYTRRVWFAAPPAK